MQTETGLPTSTSYRVSNTFYPVPTSTNFPALSPTVFLYTSRVVCLAVTLRSLIRLLLQILGLVSSSYYLKVTTGFAALPIRLVSLNLAAPSSLRARISTMPMTRFPCCLIEDEGLAFILSHPDKEVAPGLRRLRKRHFSILLNDLFPSFGDRASQRNDTRAGMRIL